MDAKSLGKFISAVGGGPLYFMDFESEQPAIPKYDNSCPYDQIVFQYSCHVLDADGSLSHHEFIAEAGRDPRRSFAEALVADIPDNVVVFVYNKAFECTRLEELAGLYPDLAEHLMAIHGNIVDLLVPFRKGWVYNRDMGGSFSIKSVLPALFPDDPSLNYANLSGDVHNGTQAMVAFEKMAVMDTDEAAVVREALLRYCELDTFALVKVWGRLLEISGAQGESLAA